MTERESAAVENSELAAVLRRQIPSIVERWEKLARAQVPAAHRQDPLALLDNMPVFLDHIAQAVEEGLEQCVAPEMEHPSVDHAEQRSRIEGYSLDQVIHEYQLLRKAVVEILNECGYKGKLAGVHEAIDFGVRQSASRYVSRVHTDFVTVVAHEMRTPLSAISNALYILENMKMPVDLAGQQVVTASRQSRQLSRMVDDLLDFGRISQGKIDLRLELTDLNQAAREAVETVHAVADSRGQTLRLTELDEAVLVRADPLRLEQILTNLLSNAVKYTEPGGDVHIKIERLGRDAVTIVEDTGIGLDPVVLPQIFDMFHQVDPSEARSHGGLGVGLGLVRKLVEIHGGEVSAESRGPGRGSRFVVRLPLAE